MHEPTSTFTWTLQWSGTDPMTLDKLKGIEEWLALNNIRDEQKTLTMHPKVDNDFRRSLYESAVCLAGDNDVFGFQCRRNREMTGWAVEVQVNSHSAPYKGEREAAVMEPGPIPLDAVPVRKVMIERREKPMKPKRNPAERSSPRQRVMSALSSLRECTPAERELLSLVSQGTIVPTERQAELVEMVVKALKGGRCMQRYRQDGPIVPVELAVANQTDGYEIDLRYHWLRSRVEDHLALAVLCDRGPTYWQILHRVELTKMSELRQKAQDQVVITMSTTNIDKGLKKKLEEMQRDPKLSRITEDLSNPLMHGAVSTSVLPQEPSGREKAYDAMVRAKERPAGSEDLSELPMDEIWDDWWSRR